MEQQLSNGSAEPRAEGVAGLKKVRMTPMRVGFLLYCMVAAGAFGIEDMIPTSGPGLTLVMLVAFAVVWAHPISKVCSELSAIMPGEGGIYVWVKEALGEFWGFCVGWWETLSIYLSLSAYMVLIVDYASSLIAPLQNPACAFAVKLCIVAAFTIINILGLSEVSWVSTVLSIAIIVAFAGVTVVGLANWQYNPMVPFTPEGQSVVDSLGGSICIAVWMYCGYECVSNIAGELQNPEVIPKGFKIIMPIIALSYILPTLAGLVSVGHWEEWGTDGLGYGDVLTQCLGYGWGVAFIAIAIISQMSIFNAYIAAGSRGFFVLADDKLCPKFLVKTTKKTGAPIYSILLLALVTVIMMNFEFETIIIIVSPLTLIIYMVIGFALLKARKEFPVEERDCWYIRSEWLARAYAIVPLIIAIIALLVNGTEYFLLGFVSIGSGIVFYIIFKWIYKGLYAVRPENNPLNPKTRLAKGDLQRIGGFIFLFGLLAFFGTFFLAWYEGEWGPDYYLETYGSGLISNFWLMIKVGRIGGVIGAIIGAVIYFYGKKKDPTDWHGTGDWGVWKSDR